MLTLIQMDSRSEHRLERILIHPDFQEEFANLITHSGEEERYKSAIEIKLHFLNQEIKNEELRGSFNITFGWFKKLSYAPNIMSLHINQLNNLRLLSAIRRHKNVNYVILLSGFFEKAGKSKTDYNNTAISQNRFDEIKDGFIIERGIT